MVGMGLIWGGAQKPVPKKARFIEILLDPKLAVWEWSNTARSGAITWSISSP